MKKIPFDTEDFCRLGRQVLMMEAEALSELQAAIDENFARACTQLLNCTGRIIVIGMGKSGHIGRKISATLSSTGTPSFFVHAGEASHGDMGMITSQDTLIALSYSGETSEIRTILPLIKRLGVPLISITGNSSSTLSEQADISLVISISQEACPLGLAPTSSTTAMLALGDAIAITLLKAKGFTENDFAQSHPGGHLGKKLLLRVQDIMRTGTNIPQIPASANVKTALLEMTQKSMGLTSVIDADHKLVGIYTDGDLRRTLDQAQDLNTTLITQVMSTCPKTIQQTELAATALRQMEIHKITALMVTDAQDHLVGIVHMHDVLKEGIA